MHLTINATEVGRRRGGNESYIVGLSRGLAALDSGVEVSLLTCDWDGDPGLPAAFRRVNLGKYRRLPFLLWQQTIALRRLEADWYVSTFFLPILSPSQEAVLVHDLSFRAHPEYFPFPVAFYMRFLTGLAMRQADRVIVLSEFTLQELRRFRPSVVEKAQVVYPGVDSRFRPEQRPEAPEILQSYGISSDYLLAIGNIHPRKNLSRLLDAYLSLKAEGRSMPSMVWAGVQRWESDELVQRARSAGVILPGFVAEDHLPTLYRQAEMLVYPSLYEGFGLPPLEAMACGTPVIAGDTTAIPEAVGQAALTVDPTDADALASAMAQLLEMRSLRDSLRQAGIERARAFTWRRTARQLLKALGYEIGPGLDDSSHSKGDATAGA